MKKVLYNVWRVIVGALDLTATYNMMSILLSSDGIAGSPHYYASNNSGRYLSEATVSFVCLIVLVAGIIYLSKEEYVVRRNIIYACLFGIHLFKCIPLYGEYSVTLIVSELLYLAPGMVTSFVQYDRVYHPENRIKPSPSEGTDETESNTTENK